VREFKTKSSAEQGAKKKSLGGAWEEKQGKGMSGGQAGNKVPGARDPQRGERLWNHVRSWLRVKGPPSGTTGKKPEKKKKKFSTKRLSAKKECAQPSATMKGDDGARNRGELRTLPWAKRGKTGGGEDIGEEKPNRKKQKHKNLQKWPTEGFSEKNPTAVTMRPVKKQAQKKTLGKRLAYGRGKPG